MKSTSHEKIEHRVVIDAPATAVWSALTDPASMPLWLGEPEMQLEIETEWRVGGPFITRGFHNARFENRGAVLAFEPPRLLRYSHLSSISRLPDRPESYSVFEFSLSGDTELRLALSGFPTESIRKHLDFYWRGTLGVLKRFVER